jgi:hypothetical protein
LKAPTGRLALGGEVLLQEGNCRISGLATDLFVIAHDIAEAAANAGFPRTVVERTLLAVHKKLQATVRRYQREWTVACVGQVRVLTRGAETGVGPAMLRIGIAQQFDRSGIPRSAGIGEIGLRLCHRQGVVATDHHQDRGAGIGV